MKLQFPVACFTLLGALEAGSCCAVYVILGAAIHYSKLCPDTINTSFHILLQSKDLEENIQLNGQERSWEGLSSQGWTLNPVQKL